MKLTDEYNVFLASVKKDAVRMRDQNNESFFHTFPVAKKEALKDMLLNSDVNSHTFESAPLQEQIDQLKLIIFCMLSNDGPSG